MMILVSGASTTLRKLGAHPNLGVLITPRSRNNIPEGWRWAGDNDAFTGFHAERFEAMLEKHAEEVSSCLFIAAPDVIIDGVGDALQTRAQFDPWQEKIARYSYPVAYVLQDGQRAGLVPWDRIAAVFVGGSTEFKLSDHAARLCAEAKARGKHVHVGRVNTSRRFRHALRIGADTIDGTAFSRWPDFQIPRGLEWIKKHRQQGELAL